MHSILVCDVGGQPHHWTDWKTAVILKYKDLLSYENGDQSIFHGGYSRMTGERSQIDIAPIIFLKESLSYDSRVLPLTNENLFARDRYTCLYCGRFYPTSKLSRDHIVPTSRGGKNIWSNVATSCKACNHAKADKLLSEIDMELIAVPYVPNHSERLIMQNRKILANQMDFLQSFLPEHSRMKDGFSFIKL